MRVGILTSSRADFGIYLPLLKELRRHADVRTELIVFGTHLSHCHGYTAQHILDEGFSIDHRIESMLLGDTEEALSTGIGLTVTKFASFWQQHGKRFDWVLCLGDRFEMFAAVAAGIPFNIRFAHIHGGETTLGAIDNTFRHAITHASKMHFTATEAFLDKVKQLVEPPYHIFNVGALSLDNLGEIPLHTNEEILQKWDIDLSKPTVLVTFHPETVKPEINDKYGRELVDALLELSQYQFVITMPNADTAGNRLRALFTSSFKDSAHVRLVENFGTRGYFTMMARSRFLLGNTSSGIIEAASFDKYVLNLGDRQRGRLCGKNVINIPVSKTAILEAVTNIEKLPAYNDGNIYWNGGAAVHIVEQLINHNNLSLV
ncbi:UDP-N-acetylglucosamine 2-epimerase [uncultured Chitinophaga sp.]|uniref:UDP-N-acetylglucosamine 2-epimerase n=1 Tax=uncultured Chitinophaga sp. TaxID=339340 RepID=UPI0025CFAEE0|nr:UDP-N-acetylglucosamine 2-epimerase [uncultured Chitinophaga sp.]